MIEQLIDGRDITVGILFDRALPVIELKTRKGFYDYDAKYSDEQTQFLFDTIKEPQIIEHINSSALNCFNALGCRHFARVDFRLTDDGRAFALEVNAIPGFTARSDLPKAAARLGLSMSRLCKQIVEVALKEKLLCS
jgi:D-alanine-D-alanine ligase